MGKTLKTLITIGSVVVGGLLAIPPTTMALAQTGALAGHVVLPGTNAAQSLQQTVKPEPVSPVSAPVKPASTQAVGSAVPVSAPAAPVAATPAQTKPAPAPVAPQNTLGIDVATPQAGMNFQEAKAQGAGFAIVKMGGRNTGSEYVAPDYATQIDSARSAGLDIGHYYVPGAGATPKAQADYMVDHLHNFNKNTDVLALDDEVLDSNGTFFNDTQAGQFFAELQARTGIAANHLWFYVDASNAHEHGPWTNVKNLGAKVWWASYGDNTSGHVPTNTPELDGSFPKADVHQFSSEMKLAGKTVDGDYTSEPLTQLF